MSTVANPYQAPSASVQPGADERAPVKLFSFEGRLGRLRGVVYPVALSLIFYAALFVAGIVGALLGLISESLGTLVAGVAAVAGMLCLMVANISVIVRRLHDTNQSGWLTLLFLLPIVNLVLWLYLIFAPGTQGPNRFGPQPVPNTGLTWAGLVLVVAVPVAMIALMTSIAVPAYQDYLERAQLQEQSGGWQYQEDGE